MPCAAPWLFTPTEGRQQTTVGEASRVGRSSGTSITTATFSRSPASQCSLCARIVDRGVTTVKLEQCSPRAPGRVAGGGSGGGSGGER